MREDWDRGFVFFIIWVLIGFVLGGSLLYVRKSPVGFLVYVLFMFVGGLGLYWWNSFGGGD